jgi:high-affinity Fe2+/Pb2+ permease
MIYFAHGEEVHEAAATSNSTPLIIAAIVGAFIVVALVAYVLRKSRTAKLPADKAANQSSDSSE